MSRWVVRALRAVIAVAGLGSLVVQTVMVPLLWQDLDDAGAGVRIPVVIIVVLGIVTLQVTAWCIWRLLGMLERGTVFSVGAFRYVDVVIGAIGAASILTFGLAVVAAPGEDVAPGVVALLCGASLVIAGVALVVWVLRLLLAQAVDLETQTRQLQSELAEVI